MENEYYTVGKEAYGGGRNIDLILLTFFWISLDLLLEFRAWSRTPSPS